MANFLPAATPPQRTPFTCCAIYSIFDTPHVTRPPYSNLSKVNQCIFPTGTL